MPSVDENRRNWSTYAWPDGGEEWSRGWGGTAWLWHGTIAPRIAGFLPAGHLLEIAPGYGRITRFLVPLCDRITLVDLVPECIERCRERFRGVPGVSCVVTDGRSLPGVETGSIDFGFSWDSLVHAEMDVMQAYLRELARVLRPGGSAFLHHSNLGEYADARGHVPLDNPHWRSTSVSASLVRRAAAAAGLGVLAQELLPWGGEVFNDCLSLVARAPGPAAPVLIRNADFGREVGNLRRIAGMYRRPEPAPL
jgi:SAM-dependent methyltransferase